VTIVRAADLELTTGDINRAAARFGIAETEPLGGFENLLLRSSEQPGRVLRLTHTSRRSVAMIEAEFEFMDHLSSHGVPVVAPVRSREDRLVEEVRTEAGDDLVVACMVEAPGRFRRRDEWADSEIETYGELLGAAHAAMADFAPGTTLRPPWTDPIFDVGFDPAIDAEFVARVDEIRAECAAHPAGAVDMLIHQDAHFGNLNITDEGRISLFDFDDCGYGTPTHDVAIVLFYWVMGAGDDQHDRVRRFLRHFMRGYERRASLPANWPEGADLFLTFREVDIYWLISLESIEDSSPLERTFMERRRERILDGVPFLGVPLADVI
jgi:Ser/Thr protein kinase RdoA (MazF antagonist)